MYRVARSVKSVIPYLVGLGVTCQLGEWLEEKVLGVGTCIVYSRGGPTVDGGLFLVSIKIYLPPQYDK